MRNKKESTNTSFSQQQGTQVTNACERVQNALGINNSTIAGLNEDLVDKADEIAIKWRACGLPYNAICDAVIEMAIWQKEQMSKFAIDGCYIKRNKYNKENVLNGLNVTCDAIQKFKDGDKVKVIIVKEDEQ